MTVDTIQQWQQLVSFKFTDAHPVFHTLMLWLITRVWDSPAAVVIFQILVLSISVAWGINLLDKEGLPRWASWLISFSFALSPVNGDLVISIWKDIPYSTLLFLLWLMVLNIVFSKGMWLAKPFSWLWLAFIGLGVAIIRHNGLPVPIITFLILIVVYRTWWKQILGALILFLGLWAVIRGPIYGFLQVDRSFGSVQQILIHHIAAHVVKGGPLTIKENELANMILPLDQWQYNCCSNVATMRAKDFSDFKNSQLSNQFNELSTELAIKEPGVEFAHQACVSSPAWEIPSMCKYDFIISAESRYWVAANDLNIYQDSKLPSLVPIVRKMINTISQPPYDIPFYTPALFFYFGIYCTFLLSYRFRENAINLYFNSWKYKFFGFINCKSFNRFPILLWNLPHWIVQSRNVDTIIHGSNLSCCKY